MDEQNRTEDANETAAQNASPQIALFDDYQRQSRKTWQLVHTDHPIVYPTLGLVNEAGELAGKVKKIFRDKNGAIAAADRAALKQELGDVLWYLAQICTELDLTLSEVAESNLVKLFSRLERGQIGGEGDDR
jgi:NTP pyrophosphatase (non-canonical NTP hydrolase)